MTKLSPETNAAASFKAVLKRRTGQKWQGIVRTLPLRVGDAQVIRCITNVPGRAAIHMAEYNVSPDGVLSRTLLRINAPLGGG